jgi:uncharacterized protein (DUF1697 family)
MATWVAFFRGINVGGNHILPMKALAALLAEEGLSDVATYIQSGNVVFRSARATAPALEKRIGAAVSKQHGFQPRVLVLSTAELARAIAANPFPQADADPKQLHLFFLAEKPSSANLDALKALEAGSEAFELIDKVFYLYTPEGFGVSKLATRAERHLGVDATARNWRTAGKVLEMAKRLEG